MPNTLRLLMIEDSSDDAELIRLELEKAGFEIDWRRVWREQDYVESLDEDWDLVISDFKMPEFDGLRAFELFRERQLDTPFIFVSGALGEERAVEAMRAGARDYFLKGKLARLGVAVKRELAEVKNRAARKRAESLARRQQRRLTMAVEASGAGVFEHRLPLGPDTYHSDRWSQILGYTRDELPPHETFLDWMFAQVHPDDVVVIRRAYDDLVQRCSDHYSVEIRMQHRDGHWVHVGHHAKVVERGGDDHGIHVVGVMFDLTKQRELEEQFRQAQKMEAIGRLAGGVAHDFNNLLTAILSFGQFVLEELDRHSTSFEDMEEVLKAAKRAEALTAQLLAFSRSKPVSPLVVTINALIGDMERMLKRVVGADVVVTTTLAQDLWNTRVDPGSIEQVVMNLAVNARDAMPDGGHLALVTKNVVVEEGPEPASGTTMRPGQYVVLSISDDGMGMSDETRERIFEPFFTTKAAGHGTGLGLSTCYGIVKQARGYVWVRSEIGVGTTFEVYLPRAIEERDELRTSRVPTELGGTETILIAEDEEPVRRLAVRSLTRLGYEVVAARNGEEALAQCESVGASIDLVVTDLVMPGIGGKELVQRLAQLRPGFKVLYMSGYSAERVGQQQEEVDSMASLQKPFSPEEIARKVRQVLDE